MCNCKEINALGRGKCSCSFCRTPEENEKYWEEKFEEEKWEYVRENCNDQQAEFAEELY